MSIRIRQSRIWTGTLVSVVDIANSVEIVLFTIALGWVCREDRSFVIYFFSTKFDLNEGTLGNTFFTTSFVASLSNLVAASLARRIGNVKTMAFTHLPSAIFLSLIPVPRSFQMARIFLVARFCTAQMDGAPRTAFLASYIPEDERTSVMGIINVIKTICQSFGPSLTGFLGGRGMIWLSFCMAGMMKASYDLSILYFFTRVKMES